MGEHVLRQHSWTVIEPERTSWAYFDESILIVDIPSTISAVSAYV